MFLLHANTRLFDLMRLVATGIRSSVHGRNS